MLRGSLVFVRSNRHISENPNSPKCGEVLGTGLAARQLFEEKRPLEPCHAGQRASGASVKLGRDKPLGQRTPTPGKPRRPHPQRCHGHSSPHVRAGPNHPLGLPSSLLTFCPPACLPAIPIPVVHLHLDGPARQRARGGVGLPRHLRGPETRPFPCSWARSACRHTHQAPGPSVEMQQPKRQRNDLEAF